ncbi:hypothetical protein MTR67_040114 [Solanum verrucosum]|uniref:Reverse transcriptase domain-containing protein n=1 Tax=Solanum verrucosum TaxID=315347 RepID=A0AAF0ZRU3_SOLVR|nr:hypothetical protein MTR67_040114 [Solanum verrucosum]
MSQFVSGVSKMVVKECCTAMLINEMDISYFMIHAQQIEEEKLKEKSSNSKRARTGDGDFSHSRFRDTDSKTPNLKLVVIVNEFPKVFSDDLLVISFDLTNAPAPFMDLMNRVFKKCLDMFVIVFIDDILIYSRSEDERVEHLSFVLQIFKDRELYLKRIKVVKNWPRLLSTSDIRSFMDLAGYYRSMSVIYYPTKANVVADTLSRLSMGGVSYIEDGKKDLVRDVHRLTRLCVCLIDSNEGGVIVPNGSESSLIYDVKAKQDLDPVLVELKKSVFKKEIEAFS